MSKIAFMFPGQGAQKAGMGKDFYEQSETARKVIDKAAELLDIDMKALCFEENDKLDQTEYTQAQQGNHRSLLLCWDQCTTPM